MNGFKSEDTAVPDDTDSRAGVADSALCRPNGYLYSDPSQSRLPTSTLKCCLSGYREETGERTEISYDGI